MTSAKNEILPFARTWMDLEGIMLSKNKPQRKQAWYVMRKKAWYVIRKQAWYVITYTWHLKN